LGLRAAVLQNPVCRESRYRETADRDKISARFGKAGFVRVVKQGTELIFINHALWKLLTNEPLPKMGG
jgi:hypothetical protein